MNKIIIIGIGIGSVSLKYLNKALRQVGYCPVVLGRRAAFSEQIKGCLDDLEFHEVDTSTVGSVVDYIHQHPQAFGDVVGITGLFDEMFPLIESVARHFRWLSPGSVAAALSDKRRVMEHVPEFSPAGLCFTARDLPGMDSDSLGYLGDGFVTKPVLASGGIGIKHFKREANIAFQLAEHLERSGFAANTQWLLQQDLCGQLLSFEGYVDGGTVYRLGVSRRSRIGFTEVANRYPAHGSVDEGVMIRGWDCIECLVQRADFHFGYFHCEFIDTGEGVYLVDANIGRIGGATLLEQIALAHGLDTTHLLAHALLLPLLKGMTRIEMSAAIRRSPQNTLGIWYGIPVEATLERVQLTGLRSHHTQFASNGMVVPRVGESDYAWVGTLSGHEHEVLSDIHGITVLTDKGSFAPAFSLE
jgi:hypothetical protein